MLSGAQINLSAESAPLSTTKEIEKEKDIFEKHEKLLSLLDFQNKI